MIRILLGTSLALALALSWFIWDRSHLKVQNAALSRSVAALSTKTALTNAALKVMTARAVTEAARRNETQRAIEALLTGDFANADEPLDPALIHILDCLRDATDRPDCS